ncbi:MAG: intermembrane transport protein PqiB [Saccharospirillaceae bacterium]|nr:intermembrane transport protein PqiB [Colwellia sp.]NRB77232.1 intermembrane transport protein PqiB [Saccharospirillaceae bacterium]
MTNNESTDISNEISKVSPAKIEQIKSISMIWFVPFIALLIGAWMVYYQWSNEGPLITIAFDSAEGMEIGKTKIKTFNVDIGEVKNIVLNENADGVIVTVRMAKNAEKLLNKNSDFWLVSPQISHTGISGLSTLISGVYIEFSPASIYEEETDELALEFIALKDPPVTPPGTPGLHLTLNSNDQFAYSKGDPIIYKGLTVGQFEHIYFNFEERIVYYNAFIKAPYHQLVTTNTKFWDVSGMRMDLTADGLSIQTGNIETMLTNGVTFDVPKGMENGEEITERTDFDIYANYKAADDERYKNSIEYVVLVSNTIRGLNVGAPVEYRGVLLGHVKSVNLLAKRNNNRTQPFDEDIKIPILISLQPGRVGLPDNEIGVRMMEEQHELWIKDGLRASLKTGSLLTGSLFIDFQHYPNLSTEDKNIKITDFESSQYDEYTIIPSVDDEFSQITAKATQFIDNLNALPLEEMSGNTNKLITEFTQTAKSFQSVSDNLSKVLDDVNQQQLSQELKTTLQSYTKLSKDLSSGSKGYEDLRQTLSALTKVMNELQPLLNQLKHQPNGLIFESGKADAIEPKKHNPNNKVGNIQ